jgi:predicted nucleotidyltransferase
MPNLLEIVSNLADSLDRLKLRYAVGGAIANGFWGIVRTTKDVDCLVAIPATSYQLLADELNSLDYSQLDEDHRQVKVTVPRMRAQASGENLIECYVGGVRVELFMPIVPLQEQILRRAVMLPIGEREARITTAEDLILLKLAFHRPKDLQDVRGILWVQRNALDYGYMAEWAANALDDAAQKELQQLVEESRSTGEE